MNIRIEIERQQTLAASPAQVAELLQDMESALRRFPKLRKLHVLGEQDFRIDMQTIGSSIAKIAHDVSFGARCSVDTSRRELSWKPLPKVGNAQLEGSLRWNAEGQGTRLTLAVRGELRDVPVPLLYRLVAPAFIQGKFSALVDAFLERTAAAALKQTAVA